MSFALWGGISWDHWRFLSQFLNRYFETHDGKYCTPGCPTLSTLVRIQKSNTDPPFSSSLLFFFFNAIFLYSVSLHSPYIVLAHTVMSLPRSSSPDMYAKASRKVCSFIQCKMHLRPPLFPLCVLFFFCLFYFFHSSLAPSRLQSGSLPLGRLRVSWHTFPTRRVSSPASPWCQIVVHS